jgi:hypothetical protein
MNKPGVGQFPCPCGAQEGGCGCSCQTGVGSFFPCPCGSQEGGCRCGCGVGRIGVGRVGQVSTPQPMSVMDLLMGALAIVGAGTVAFAGYEFIKGSTQAHEEMLENPTLKRSRRAYDVAIYNLLRKRYGLSSTKANRALNSHFVGGRVTYLFNHNYNVAYAADQIHRSIRLEFYPRWQRRGFMPLYRHLPRRGQR